MGTAHSNRLLSLVPLVSAMRAALHTGAAGSRLLSSTQPIELCVIKNEWSGEAAGIYDGGVRTAGRVQMQGAAATGGGTGAFTKDRGMGGSGAQCQKW